MKKYWGPSSHLGSGLVTLGVEHPSAQSSRKMCFPGPYIKLIRWAVKSFYMQFVNQLESARHYIKQKFGI